MVWTGIASGLIVSAYRSNTCFARDGVTAHASKTRSPPQIARSGFSALIFAMQARVPSAACSSGWMWTSVKWTNEKSLAAASAAGGPSAVATAPSAPTVRNERLFTLLVELVPEAQHHHVHVRDTRVGLPRRRQKGAARR